MLFHHSKCWNCLGLRNWYLPTASEGQDGGYPGVSPCPGMRYPLSWDGVFPRDKTTEGILAMQRAVCLLCSRRRTFLFLCLSLFSSNYGIRNFTSTFYRSTLLILHTSFVAFTSAPDLTNISAHFSPSFILAAICNGVSCAWRKESHNAKLLLQPLVSRSALRLNSRNRQILRLNFGLVWKDNVTWLQS